LVFFPPVKYLTPNSFLGLLVRIRAYSLLRVRRTTHQNGCVDGALYLYFRPLRIPFLRIFYWPVVHGPQGDSDPRRPPFGLPSPLHRETAPPPSPGGAWGRQAAGSGSGSARTGASASRPPPRGGTTACLDAQRNSSPGWGGGQGPATFLLQPRNTHRAPVLRCSGAARICLPDSTLPDLNPGGKSGGFFVQPAARSSLFSRMGEL